MDREKLAKEIGDCSLILNDEREIFLRRLAVASHEGCAKVVRDYEEAKMRGRSRVMNGRHVDGRKFSPLKKVIASFSTKSRQPSFATK